MDVSKFIPTADLVDAHAHAHAVAEPRRADDAPIPGAALLDDLLSRVTPENIHPEVPTGDAVGREVW